MPVSEQKKIQHLLWRAGFGPTASSIKDFSSKEKALEKLFADTKNYTPIDILGELPVGNEAELLAMSKEKKAALFKKSREEVKQLNIEWFNKMADDRNALLEKMTLFWHGHFATRLTISRLAQLQNNTIRENALGKFSDLLMAVSKDPGMLQFLSSQQNKKDSPNENFAREVLELFTLGRGNYTEADIKNAARAFTGWGFKFPGVFIFRERQHDFDTKTFLGKTGNFTGDDIISIILNNKQTARFITTKIYNFFVNDKPDEAIVEQLADSFYKSAYDIEKLMRTIFTSDWFYEDRNIGVKIKSPVELLVGMNKLFNITFADDRINLFNQKVLGQVLLFPPNVAGWPGSKNWIDSSSLLYRMKLPEMIFVSSELNISPKEDPSTETGEAGSMMMEGDDDLKKKLKQIDAKVDWQPFLLLFSNIKSIDAFKPLAAFLLQTNEEALDRVMIEGFINGQSTEERLKQLAIRLLALPDYQLC